LPLRCRFEDPPCSLSEPRAIQVAARREALGEPERRGVGEGLERLGQLPGLPSPRRVDRGRRAALETRRGGGVPVEGARERAAGLPIPFACLLVERSEAVEPGACGGSGGALAPAEEPAFHGLSSCLRRAGRPMVRGSKGFSPNGFM